MNLLTKFEVRNFVGRRQDFSGAVSKRHTNINDGVQSMKIALLEVDQSRGLKLRFYKQVTKIKGGPIGCTELPLISFEHVFGRISSLTFMTPCGRFNRELMNEYFI